MGSTNALFGLVLALAPQLATAQSPCGSDALLNELDAGVAGPVLRTPDGAPVLGGPFRFRVEKAQPNMTGVLVYSAVEAPTFDPGYEATFWLGVPFDAIVFDTDALGRSPDLVVVPELDPSLCGSFAIFQAGVFDPGATGGLGVTNAIRLRIGEPGFHAWPLRGVGEAGNARAFTFADLDGDGIRDLVSSVVDPSIRVTVERGLAEGGFDDVDGFHSPFTLPFDLEAADFDGDGALDVLTAEREGRARVIWGTGTGFLRTSTLVTTSNGSRECEIADFDGDGALDFVTADSTSNKVSVVLGDGIGGFAAAVGYAVGGLFPYDVDVADIDADGEADLVVAVRGADKITTRKGNGDGTFGGIVSYASGDEPWHLVVRDLDGDGELDVASTNRGSEDVTVHLGAGGGTLSAGTSVSVGGAAFAIEAVDVDDDGALDLLAGVEDPDGVAVLYGDGLGAFTPGAGSSSRFDTLDPVVAFELEDVDRDGAADLVMLGGHPDANGFDYGGPLTVLSRTASGGFDPARLPADSVAVTTTSVPDFALVDLDGDGALDLGVPEPFAVAVHPGQGDGTFGARVESTHGFSNWASAFGDVNGDAIPDTVLSVSGLQTMLGTGGGSFAAPGAAAGTNTGSRLDLADLNGDSDLDAVALEPAGFGISAQNVYLGNGDGTFVVGGGVTFPTGTNRDAALGDLNGDGVLDLVTVSGFFMTGAPPGSQLDYFVTTYLGDGAGGFTIEDSLQFTAWIVRYPSLRDLDEDGYDDLIAAYQSNSFSGSASLRVWPGIGDGSLGTPTSGPATGTGADHFDFADLDGDGNLDVVLGGSRGLQLVPGDVGFGFEEPVRLNLPLHAEGHFVELGDLDLDGIPDFAYLHEDGLGQHTIRTVLNELAE